MTASPAPTETTGAAPRKRSRIALVVFGSIAFGFVLGLLLTVVVFAGGEESQITGSALLALGAGFTLLALASSRFTDQPQRWALAPGVAAAGVGLAILLFAPGNRVLGLAGWVWPVLLLVLVGWSFWGARRSLHNWSRRALLYPALFVLLLVAIGGAYETVAEATSSNPAPAGRTYLVNVHRLYLNCVGTGAPTVVLFNGLGERTPSWAWVQRSSRRRRVSVRSIVLGKGGAVQHQVARTATSWPPTCTACSTLRTSRGRMCWPGTPPAAYALVYAARYPQQVAGVALIDSATPYQFDLPDYPGFYSLWRRASALLPSLSRAGFGRLVLDTGYATLPPDARDALRAFAAEPRELRANHAEFAELRTVFDQAKALTSLGGKPLGVVSADVGQQAGWSEAQAKLAQLSSNSVHRTTRATHEALLEDERFAAITSRTIIDVVRATREGQFR